MQVRKLHEQQGTKPIARKTNAEARITAFKAQLGVHSQPWEGSIKRKEGEAPKEQAWER